MTRCGAGQAAAIVALSLASSASAQGTGSRPTPRSGVVAIMSNIDQHFICPEFLPDDTARAADLAAFSQSLSSIRPQPAPAQIDHVRSMLMTRHNCSQLALTMAEPTAPATSADPAVIVASVNAAPAANAIPN